MYRIALRRALSLLASKLVFEFSRIAYEEIRMNTEKGIINLIRGQWLLRGARKPRTYK